ncbi:MAG: hemolysin D, partial [Pirellula sp.]
AMSSGSSEENVEQTKRQIRTLVNEVAELSKSDVGAAEFYPAVLQKVVNALAARGGAVWLLDGENGLRLAHHIDISPNLIDANNNEAISHGRLLGRLIQKGTPELVPPFSASEQTGEANPTPFLLVTSPLASPKGPVGLLEVFQRAQTPPEAQVGYLKFVKHITDLVGDWLKGGTNSGVPF